MNGQIPQMKKWKDIVEELKIAIHNTEMNLELLKSQLATALKQAR